MFDYFKSWFFADEKRRHETENERQARKLEMDAPMAGAGALLSGERNKSESEKNLEKDTAQRG